MTTILILLLCIQVFYWMFFFAKLSRCQPSMKSSNSQEPVSIIMAARNEASNLALNLPDILDQDYSDYQIIIIDDHSNDGTEKVIQKMDDADRKIMRYKSNQNAQGKKQAIKQGIALSQHDVLLMTDADCRPLSDLWIRSMTGALSDPEHGIVLGYSPYKMRKGLLSLWVHFENWLIGVQYLSYALRRIPYMGVGRNLLYRKSLLSPEMIKAYEHLLSGDDDLTIMQMADKHNTTICIDPDSFVETEAPDSFSAYLKQKRRHLTTAPYYKWIHKFLLGIFGASHSLFYLMTFVCLYSGEWKVAISAVILRLMFMLPIANGCRLKLHAEFSMIQFLYLDVLLAMHYLFFGILSFIPYKQKW